MRKEFQSKLVDSLRSLGSILESINEVRCTGEQALSMAYLHEEFAAERDMRYVVDHARLVEQLGDDIGRNLDRLEKETHTLYGGIRPFAKCYAVARLANLMWHFIDEGQTDEAEEVFRGLESLMSRLKNEVDVLQKYFNAFRVEEEA